MRIALRLVSAVLTLIPLTLALLFAAIWFTLPGGDMTLAIPGLSAPVDIGIDADGIPRVRAQTTLDGAAALGFLHARDRLFEMDLMRRAASGELAELAGPAALPIDRFMRVMGVRAQAQADLATLAPDARAALDAYANGVNAWIERRGRFAGLEFLALGRPRPWSPVDSLLWGKTMGLYLSGNWRVELARLALAKTMRPEAIAALWPDQGTKGVPFALAAPNERLAATALALNAAIPVFPAPFTLPSTASNAWAVDGAHAVHGAPLLAGDPHLAFGLPGIWYLARIDTPQGSLAGATAPGVPMLVIGHNSHIAWSFTTTGADTQDLFIETPSGDGYATPDGPKPFATREERIHVRGAADVVLQVRATRHGPVISDLVDPSGPMLALSMANLQPGDTAATGLLALDRAANVDEAGRAAAQITQPVQNLMVADHDRIALFVTGRVPVRRTGDGGVPAAGADGGHDWTGFASGEQLPHYAAPGGGRLVNANDRVAPPDFPVFMGRDWFDDWRAQRIRTMLDAAAIHDTADFAAMQADVTSVFAQDVLPRLLTVPADGAASQQALALLKGWDARMTRDAPQPLIFNAWMRAFAARVIARLGVPANAREAAAPWPEMAAHALSPAGAAWCGEDCNAVLSSTLTQAVTELSVDYGPDPAAWRWGAAHQAVFAHPVLRQVPLLGRLIEARIDAPGDDATVDRGGLAATGFDSVHGASYRGVYDLGDLDHSLFMVAPGQSGHPASPLSRNFVQRWRDGATVMLGPENGPATTHIRLIPIGAATP